MPYAKGSSGSYCCMFKCNNSQKKKNKWLKENCEEHLDLNHQDCPCLIPFQFHLFPRNEEERLKWRGIINRKDFTPNNRSVVCSIHFKDRRPTPENPYPSLHLGYERHTDVKPARRKLAKISTQMEHKRPKPTDLDIANDEAQPEQCHGDLSDRETIPLPSSCKETIFRDSFVQASAPMVSVSTQWDPRDLPVHVDHSYCKVVTSKANTTFANVGTQCNMPCFTSKLMSDDDIRFYTGLSSVVFFKLVAVLMSFGKSPFKLDLSNQILLVLSRLRLALLNGDLSRRFGISTSVASRVIRFWIPRMADALHDGVTWLPRVTIRNTMPDSFKLKYPKTTCIIDCTEVFMEKGTNHWIKATTFSNYKNHNTLKFLVAIAPNGLIMYVSNCYGGRATDQFITKNCGFLSYLLPGDEIMADRGFLIEEDLPPFVKINVPAFTKGREQLPEHEVVRSRRIASVRVHVERVIGRLKNYRILKNCYLLSQTKQVDSIVIICSALCNLQNPIVS